MEKDIDRIQKNPDTDIIIRIDDFGGKVGLTIREFVRGERYTGFTKAGTRIPAEQFKNFKAAINSIKESDFETGPSEQNNSHSNGTSGQKEAKTYGKNTGSQKRPPAPADDDIEEMAI